MKEGVKTIKYHKIVIHPILSVGHPYEEGMMPSISYQNLSRKLPTLMS